MQPVQRMVICGSNTSVFLMAIEASLAARPEVDVFRLDPHLPNVVDRIVALEPHVVMIERGGGQGDLALALLDHGFPLIEMNADQNRVTILTGRQVSISQADEFAQVIAHVTQKLPSFSTGERKEPAELE